MKSLSQNRYFRTIALSVAFAGTVLMSGCAAYVPQSVSMPMIDHKGALNVDMSIYPVENTVEGQVSAAYGFTDHIAAQVYASNIHNPCAQAMVGVYWPVQGSHHVDVYGGYSLQHAETRAEDVDMGSTTLWEGDHNLVFLQSDFGVSRGEISKIPGLFYSYGVMIRTGVLSSDMSKIQNRFDANGDPIPTEPEYWQTNHWVVEPGIQLGLGWKCVGLNVRACYSLPVQFGGERTLDYFPINALLGLSLKFF